MQLTNVNLHRIEDNPWQTRRALDEEYIKELAADIERNGLMHPPAGRIVLHGKVLDYELYGGPAAALQDELDAIVQLAVGHNRKAAYALLNRGPADYRHMPMQIGKYSDEQMAKMAWAENAQRKDLSPVEESRAIQRVIDDFGWTQAQAAEHFGLNRSTITNKLRLLQLPDELLDQIHAGAISERQAVAMLPLYKTPEPVRERIANPRVTWVKKPETIIKAAAEGASSDALRKEVDRMVEAATGDLERARFPLDVRIAEGHDGVQSAKCTECPLKLGTKAASRCGDPGCYDAKTDYWRRHRLAQAREVVALPVVPEGVDSWNVEDFGHDDAIHGATILEQGCPHERLCLMYRPTWTSEYYLAVEGVPDVHIVCNRGERGRCGCLQKARNAAQEQDPEAKAEKEAKQRLQAEIVDPAVAALAEVLEEMEPEAWRLVVDAYVYGVKADGRQWPSVCRSVAKKLVDNQVGWDAHKKLDRTRADIDAMLEKASVSPDYPTAEKAIDDLRRRFERIKGWTEKFETDVPSKKQLRGNLDNLDQLHKECEALWRGTVDEGDLDGDLEFIADAGSVSELDGEIISLMELVRDVLKVMEEDPPNLGTFYLTSSRLLHSAPGSPNFEAAADIAETGLIRFCLALLHHDDNAHAWHIQALERRLKEEIPA